MARVLQLFAGEQLSGEVSASDVGTDLAAPLALRAMCTLALLDAGHAGLEARKGADVPALSMPYTVVRLLVRGPVTPCCLGCSRAVVLVVWHPLPHSCRLLRDRVGPPPQLSRCCSGRPS